MKRMLLKLGCAALVAAIVVGAATQAAAQEKKEGKKPAAAAAAKGKKGTAPFKGKIEVVDKTAKTIKVGERTFQATSSTRIAKAGKPATLDDAAVGDEVGGTFTKTEDGKLNLNVLRIGPKPEKTGEAKPAKKAKTP